MYEKTIGAAMRDNKRLISLEKYDIIMLADRRSKRATVKILECAIKLCFSDRVSKFKSNAHMRIIIFFRRGTEPPKREDHK